MKTITLLTGLTLMFLGCVTKFSYMKAIKREDYDNFNPVKTDSTYELYVRQVVKIFDSASRVHVPGNGKVADGIELIEIEYLLISRTQKKSVCYK